MQERVRDRKKTQRAFASIFINVLSNVVVERRRETTVGTVQHIVLLPYDVAGLPCVLGFVFCMCDACFGVGWKSRGACARDNAQEE